MPSEPVNLTVDEIRELNQRLSTMRHDINNNLSLLIAATELMRAKPQMVEKMLDTLCAQPPKISAAMTKFSAEFEKAFHIEREAKKPQ
ncbi:MAG TPA: hypothetical protein VG754_08310 [Verrucomicrobiae bacterium]|nr:hypothetical protein [Verrucomicrobiae bacterium]